MSFRSHEFPQHRSNDPRKIINTALVEGLLLNITYRTPDGKETKRKIKPIEWVEDYKIKAYCYLRNDERQFVLSRIKEISIIIDDPSEVPQTTTIVRPPRPREEIKNPPTGTPPLTPKPDASDVFSRVSTNEQWRNLIRYYADCLNREYLQDYVFDQQDTSGYMFFLSEEDITLRFLAGGSTFAFDLKSGKQSNAVAEFILNPEKHDQQLCIGFPSLVAPQGKLAPLFFSPCEVIEKPDEVQIVPDEYELSYGVFEWLALDKEEFATVVAELSEYEFEDHAPRLKALQDAVILKIEELTRKPLPRREVNRSVMTERVDQVMLLTTPCLFWVSKNNITNDLIGELNQISGKSLDQIPQVLKDLINISPVRDYPAFIPLVRDPHVYVTKVNDEQRTAGAAALTGPSTVVTGPPGTGKSQLVVNIIANAVIDGKTVLFASRNNRAVDVVFNRIRSDMKFDGMIRTGNRVARKEAAAAMLSALSRAALPHTLKDQNTQVEQYKQLKYALVSQQEKLDEIQRLRDSIWNKQQAIDALVGNFPEAVAQTIKSEARVLSADAIELNKATTLALMPKINAVRQKIDLAEMIVQEHITRNEHKHQIILDIEAYEREWGSFGEGIRGSIYFPTISALLRYADVWLSLLTAIQAKQLIDKLTADIQNHEHKLDEFIRSLSALSHKISGSEYVSVVPDLLRDEALSMVQQSLAHEFSKNASYEKLNVLKSQIEAIEEKTANLRKRNLSNWLGFRLSPQTNEILGNLNSILAELGLETLPHNTAKQELLKTTGAVKNFVRAIAGLINLREKKTRLATARQGHSEIVARFNEKTRRDLARLSVSHNDMGQLKHVLLDLKKEVLSVRIEYLNCAEDFKTQLKNNKMLTALWSGLIYEWPGLSEKTEWSADDVAVSVMHHAISQWLSLLQVVQLRADIAQLESIVSTKGSEKEIIQRIEELHQGMSSLADEVLIHTWRRNIDNLDSEQLQRVRDHASLIQELFDNYDRPKYRDMMAIQENHVQDLISAFPVWATTNLSIGRNLPLKPGLFDILIVDEASQCDIPSALPLIFRAKQLVIIGDAMQLRHIATLMEDSHQALAGEYKVATEVYSYTKHSLFDLAARSVGQHPGIQMLREHYRSHKNIIEFSNQTFYDNKLVVKTNLFNRKIPDEVTGRLSGIFWLNIAGKTIHPAGGSAKNISEIEAIKLILPKLIDFTQKNAWDASIGIVTPYREQRNIIQNWVNSKFGDSVTVGTAHTFQGDEKDILLFSTVLADGISQGNLGWLKNTNNLLNVAVTRARTLLLIVGDFDFCSRLASDNPYRQLADYVSREPFRVIHSLQDMPVISE